MNRLTMFALTLALLAGVAGPSFAKQGSATGSTSTTTVQPATGKTKKHFLKRHRHSAKKAQKAQKAG